jgi:hypothetical protein
MIFISIFLSHFQIPSTPVGPPSLDWQHFGPVVRPYNSFSSSQMPSFSPVPELGLMPPPRHPMLDKGKNVQYAESSTSNLPRKKLQDDCWSEHELNSLCIGVHKHGCGNWEKMLRDPELRFSSSKTVDDLSAKWSKEMVQFLNGCVFKLAENIPGLSTDASACALQAKRVSAVMTEGTTPSFRSHLTDVLLGFEDLYQASGSRPPVMNTISQINAVEKTVNSINNSDLPPFLHNTFVPVSSTSHEIRSSQYGNAPDGSQKQAHYLIESGAATSKSNKLPHWLRDAIGTLSPSLPPHLPAGPAELPARLSVEQCPNALHAGDVAERRTPPFKIVGPPFQIKDPGVDLIKRENKDGEGSLCMVGINNEGTQALRLDLNFPPISCQESDNNALANFERKGCSDQAVYVVIDSSSDEELN